MTSPESSCAGLHRPPGLQTPLEAEPRVVFRSITALTGPSSVCATTKHVLVLELGPIQARRRCRDLLPGAVTPAALVRSLQGKTAPLLNCESPAHGVQGIPFLHGRGAVNSNIIRLAILDTNQQHTNKPRFRESSPSPRALLSLGS